MNIDDLRSSMRLVFADQSQAIVFKDLGIYVMLGSYQCGELTELSFEGAEPRSLCIEEVWQLPYSHILTGIAIERGQRIWKWRAPPEEMTLTEVIEELGRDIKIIKG